MDTKTVTETVTVETAKNDLSQILGQLAPSIAYDQDGYTGELALDHTTLVTEAAGYRPALPHQKAVELIVSGNCGEFAPQIMAEFIAAIDTANCEIYEEDSL